MVVQQVRKKIKWRKERKESNSKCSVARGLYSIGLESSCDGLKQRNVDDLGADAKFDAAVVDDLKLSLAAGYFPCLSQFGWVARGNRAIAETVKGPWGRWVLKLQQLELLLQTDAAVR
ncbi:hypothetical protein F0562_025534 [Nyssa sinensis]|uniref:Uncharacterized protein n=1 Tax=Nyssa sinensis TaxID=561372 RepID=A0A5J5BA67_9ASTE|nr:hypothetical protein F0562_025534 [Nyssa sinensis]